MPTYTVTTANIVLSPDTKAAIAKLITDAHGSNTGAPGFFAQVIFTDAGQGDHFVGGRPNRHRQIYVLGLIRGGRSLAVKQGILADIRDGIQKLAGISPEDIWGYIQDMVPQQMIEFGRFLPEPGAEAEWRRGFSEERLAIFREAGIDF